MNNELFRQKSIDQMKSPDNLKDYIKVVNPSVWIVFIAAFLLLTGAFVWGTFGKIEDRVSVMAIVKDGSVVCEYNDSVKSGMKVIIDGKTGTVDSVTPNGIWVDFYEPISDGVYFGHVVLGLISPISFVFN